MAISCRAKSQCSGILKDSLTASQFLQLRTFYQITGYTDHIAVAGIEGQVTQIHLEGTFDEIIDDANNLLAKGVDGIDLLAFRHKDGAELAEAYCKAIDKPVVIAGSINSPERIEFINKINPWAFTMGSALFTENFAPGKSFRENLEEVIKCMDSIK